MTILRTMGAVGAAAVGMTAAAAASPAMAAPDCGVAPVGGTLTLAGTTCQLDFSTVGAYSWTLPAGVQGLQALLLGGASGAYVDPTIGYAGEGGSVLYVDYTAAAAGEVVAVTVGAAGVTGTSPTDGTASTTILAAVPSTADGGTIAFNSYCAPEGSFSVYASNGDGAGQALSGDTGACETSYAAGINPAADAVDSYSNARPANFADFNVESGLGGRILITADTLPADAALNATGAGASIRYDSAVGQFVGANAVGGSGRVVFRYTAPELAGPVVDPPADPAVGSPALAVSGYDAAPGLMIGVLTAALGALVLARSRRRQPA